ncbi:hypothetical protein [Pseudorhodoferax soli]|uniref:Uncharacterized protein n=1 Tax=Pseudorhodoferax soli TaxID=545864 RepID=A0A368Y3C6_9BURK|nr:hypothetical protein [Pseudorhodoferax soli]RCW73808.1 hypothetical protein DES41_102122 [Pseudorhodoferax soli]
MPKFTTPAGTTQRYISALDRNAPDSIPGTKKVYADRAAFLQGVADERACIAMGLPVWYDGIDLQVLAEPAAVKRLWTLSTTAGSAAANATASHGRTAVIAFKKFTLASDDNRVLATIGAPGVGVGDNGDLALDETAGIVYRKALGAWAQETTLGGTASDPEPKAIEASTYTLLALDKTLDFKVACAVTVPPGLPRSFAMSYVVTGLGAVSFAAGSGVDLANTAGNANAAAGSSGAIVGTSTLNGLRLLNGAPASSGSTRTFRGAVADQAAMLAATAAVGDWVTRTDLNAAAYELTASPATALANWKAYGTGGATRVWRGAAANEAAMLSLSGAAVGDWMSRTDLGGIGYELKALPATTLANWQSYATLPSGLPAAVAFGTSIQLDGNRMVSAPQQVAGPMSFSLNSAGLADGARWTTVLIGDGTNTPSLGPFIKRGGVAMGNTNAQEYIVTFQRIAGKNYYTVELGELRLNALVAGSNFNTATSGTLLQDVINSAGANWVKRPTSSGAGVSGYSAAASGTSPNPVRLRGSPQGNTITLFYTCTSITMPGTGGVMAKVKFHQFTPTTGISFAIYLRGDMSGAASADKGIVLGYSTAGWSLSYRDGSGTSTALATAVATNIPAEGTDCEVVFKVEPNKQTVSVNGVEIFSTTKPDSEMTQLGTECGLRFTHTATVWSNSTGPQVDSAEFFTYLPG